MAAKQFYEKEMEKLKTKTKKELAAEKQKCTKAQNSRDKHYNDKVKLRKKQMNHKAETKEQ